MTGSEPFEPERANVVPIGGYHLPAPPDWRVSDEAETQRRLAAQVLRPEDLTLDGRPRCTFNNSEGRRCGNAVERGTTVCRMHGASHVRHEDDNRDSTNEGPGTKGRQQRIERVRTHLEHAAHSAVLAVQSILEDDTARPQDRLKAAEIVLDRTVGRTIQIEKEDANERDLDAEIMQIAADLGATGTES